MILNNAEILRFLSDSTHEYGITGKNNLEYIGLTITDKINTSAKIYLCNRDNKSKLPDWADTFWEKYYKKLSQILDMEICDTSESISDQILTYRMIVKLKNQIQNSQIKEISDYFAGTVGEKELERFLNFNNLVTEYNNINLSPLIQIGIETSQDFRYLSFKYYMTIKTKLSENPVVSADTIQMLLNIGSEQNVKSTFEESLLYNIEKSDYYPTFVGINDNGNTVENKLYYITKLYGRNLIQKAEAQTRSLCDALGLDNNLKTTITKAYTENGLYLEGLAVSTTNPDSIRIYLTEIAGKLNI
ncbi:MAG: hypothetical protein IKP88_20900 [Lachnospiraceae bacterium]|nr:hypothetical protein [Lachnospiraceae bacterium]